MSQQIAIGIDLGTTYSVMAYVDEHGRPQVIPNADSERLTPSAVFFDDGTIIVGEAAKQRAFDYPDKVALFVKRQIKNQSWFIEDKGKRYSPVDVSSFILRKLKQDAEQYLSRRINYAVITVPAYFDETARRLTQEAAMLAGLEVLSLINEPTAAAIAYSYNDRSVPRQEHAVVYDLGGGTFDVTVLQVNGSDVRVLASKGDHQLGGKDFDDKIIQLAVDQFKQQHGFDPTTNLHDANELRLKAEEIKRELSKRTKARMVVRAQGRMTQIDITREQFESLIRGRLETTIAIVEMTLQEAALAKHQIDRILLVGGSSRIPLVARMLEEHFGRSPEPFTAVHPDEAVALGAAIVAAKKMLEVKPEEVPPQVKEIVGGLSFTDVLSHSFGIAAEVPGTGQKRYSIVIRRNTPLPARAVSEFATSLPNQTAIRIQVYQGESNDLNLCNPVGEFTLSGLPPGRPPGQKVRIEFSCDTNGLIHITATDVLSGIEAQTQIGYTVGRPTEQTAVRRRWLDENEVS